MRLLAAAAAASLARRADSNFHEGLADGRIGHTDESRGDIRSR